jgi:hypothetical protein
MAVNLEIALARARRAYEVARMRRGLLDALPLLGVSFVAAVIGYRAEATLVLGSLLYASATVFLWRGRELGAAVLPGTIAGGIPLVFAICAKAYGHVCTGEACVSFCVPACITGGLLAGFSVTSMATRRSARASFSMAACFLALMTGALGCSCVGFGGVLGLVVGIATPLVVRLARESGRSISS